MRLEKTYELETGPAAVDFGTYAVESQQEYGRLLETDASEAEIQRFLELNPAFVPGARTPLGTSGHDPMHCALIAQSSLPGLNARRPDFLWIACHSSTWFPTFIEIEAPKKRLFTQAGVPTAEFSQARHQIAQWRIWLDEPANVAKLISEYGIGESYTHFRNMVPHFILIYGRRAEFEHSPGLSKQRGLLLSAADEDLVSYDRLVPDSHLSDAVTVKGVGFGRYRVKAVTPTMTLGPARADRLMYLEGFSEAVSQDKRIPAPRRDFLSARVQYWRAWARTGGGIVDTGDRE